MDSVFRAVDSLFNSHPMTRSGYSIILTGFISMALSQYVSATGFTTNVNHGEVQHETIQAGKQDVHKSGKTREVTIEKDGVQRIYDGGSTSESIIKDGGEQRVEHGGLAIGTVIHAGGV